MLKNANRTSQMFSICLDITSHHISFIETLSDSFCLCFKKLLAIKFRSISIGSVAMNHTFSSLKVFVSTVSFDPSFYNFLQQQNFEIMLFLKN